MAPAETPSPRRTKPHGRDDGSEADDTSRADDSAQPDEGTRADGSASDDDGSRGA